MIHSDPASSFPAARYDLHGVGDHLKNLAAAFFQADIRLIKFRCFIHKIPR